MLGTTGVVSSFAQGNVYSINVVGYINLDLTSEFTMVANQLDNGTGNRVADLIPTAPVGTVVYKYNPDTSAYASLTRVGTSWLPPASPMTLAPGEGVFIKKPASAASISLTFVGEVLQGTLVNPVVGQVGGKFDIYSSIVPQAGLLVTDLGYTPTSGDVVYRLQPGGAYLNSTFLPSGIWLPSQPSVNVGQAFWIKSNVNKDWTRDFTVQ